MFRPIIGNTYPYPTDFWIGDPPPTGWSLPPYTKTTALEYPRSHTEQDCVIKVIEMLEELEELASRTECPHCQKNRMTDGEEMRFRYLNRLLKDLI